MTEQEKKEGARRFAEAWKGRGDEKQETQVFWLELLGQIFGVAEPTKTIQFEKRAKSDSTGFIDAYIPSTSVLIEQKSADVDLRKVQSSGVTPYQQARQYASVLPHSEHPRWIVTCNFREFLIYDQEKPAAEPESILLEDLPKEYYRLAFLVDAEDAHISRELEVSVKAGEIVGKLYDALLKQYADPESPATLHSLNVLCVRLVFCLYAEDAGIFGKRNQFADYLRSFPTKDVRRALLDLFRILDTPIPNRDPYEDPALLAFPYVNGGLFGATSLEIPQFTQEIVDILLHRASEDFDWSQISPTIFGAVFESTLNPETRRRGGMHYTSIENIHKVIDPLFLDDLKSELDEIKSFRQPKAVRERAEAFTTRLAALTFLDPACGSGNFLTETYISLRRLENEALRLVCGNERLLNLEGVIKVDINQFHGIEINDFAVTVAKTALWIAESQMLKETESIVQANLDFLPLKTYTGIVEGNALRMDWGLHRTGRVGGADCPQSAPLSEPARITFDYIMGNPPFVGYSLQNKEQKADILSLFVDEKGKPYKTAGKIDYVSGWYWKAAELMQGTNTRAALVSTNSITQGEQVAAVWKPLMERFGVEIDFAHRTFQWDSEAHVKAHVHCVVVGFSFGGASGADRDGARSLPADAVGRVGSPSRPHAATRPKLIFTDGKPQVVKNINGYLLDADNVFVESRTQALCDVPKMVYGNKPTDGGFLFLTPQEYEEAVAREPQIKPLIRRILGSEEFINGKARYCLWLVGASPADIRRSPFVSSRVKGVFEFRSRSSKAATRKDAETPTLFQEIRQPATEYIIVPSVSSENRKYVPLGFVSPDVIVNNLVLVIPSASLYHFGVLTSSVHMAWMRAVVGRLEMRYRYSKDIVYNNFPWPGGGDSACTGRPRGRGRYGDGVAPGGRLGEPTLPETPNPGNPENPCDPHLCGFASLREKITETAQSILDARALYPDASLADLYDELTMPPELRKAHRENDRAVLAAYGLPHDIPESEIVAHLMGLYQRLCHRLSQDRKE